MKLRALSAVMAIVTLLSSLLIAGPINVAAEDAALWTDEDYIATEFDGGTGTSDDPYEIATAGQLALLSMLTNNNTIDSANNRGKKYSSLYYEVTADIDASAHQWVPIGNSYKQGARQFTGSINGNGYTITTVLTDNTNQKGSTSESSKGSAAGGLFGRAHEATITNINLKTTFDMASLPAIANGYIGGLSGALFACNVKNCHVEITASGTVNTSSKPSYHLGGIAGYTSLNSVYENCTVSGSMRIQGATASGSSVTTLNTQYIGGLFGRIDAGGDGTATYINCINYADLTVAAGNSHAYVGGFAGEMNSSTGDVHQITDFINAGDLTVSVVHVNAKAKQHIASVFGATGANGSVELVGCVNLGRISYVGRALNTTDKATAAELIANNTLTEASNTIENCYTVNPLTPAIFNYSGTAAFGDVKMTDENGSAVRGTFETSALENIVFETVRSGAQTTVILPADFVDLLEAFCTVTVGCGTKTSTAKAKNETDGTYEYTVENRDGIAYFTINDCFTVYDKWEYRAKEIANGDGSSENPYIINTAEELASLIGYYNYREGSVSTKYYRFGDDIDLSGREWTAIGSYVAIDQSDLRFKGSFDGNGKTISGMTVTDACQSDMPAALFGAVMKDSTITNFELEGEIDRNGTSADCAMICAYASGGAEFTNIEIDATVHVIGDGSDVCVGGILAYAEDATVRACGMSGSVCAEAIESVGGIVAHAETVQIADCVNAAGIETETGCAGGILGCNEGEDTVLNDNDSFTSESIGEDAASASMSNNRSYNITIETAGKASVRIDNGALENSGLRFDSFIDCSSYQSMKADGISFELGTMIAPTDFLDAFGARALPISIKIPYLVDAYRAEGDGEDGFVRIDEDEGLCYFTGAVTAIMEANYDRKYTAVAYVEITVDGKTYTIYADYSGEADRARSIREVAQAAYNDRCTEEDCEYVTLVGDGNGYSCYSMEQLAIIEHYLS